jgi:hypothetical protein
LNKLESRLGRPKLNQAAVSYVDRCVMSAVNFMSNKNRRPIPRLVPTKVGLFEQRLMVNMPYGQMTDVLDPRRGLAAALQFPCATRPLAIWKTKAITADNVIVGKLSRNDPEISGMWSLAEGDASESTTSGGWQMDNSGFENFVPLWTYTAEADSQGRCCHRAQDSNGNYFYGVPFEFDPATDNITFKWAINSTGGALTATTVTLQFVSTVGTVDTTFPIAGTDTWDSGTVTIAAKTALGGRYACCLPGAPLGIRLKAAANVEFSDFRIELTQKTNTTLGKFDYITAAVNRDIAALYNEVSVVGGGLYASYMGSSLLDGGESAYYMYRGGTYAGMDGLSSVDQLAQELEGHDNPLRQGNYCVLQPSTMEDLDFYPRREVMKQLSLSQQVMYFRIADLTQLYVVRLYSFLLCEGTSNSPLVKLEEAPPIAGGTAAYIQGINRFPSRVDNPLHWKDIKEFGRKMFGHAQHAVDFYKNNSHWINPLLGTIAAAVLV